MGIRRDIFRRIDRHIMADITGEEVFQVWSPDFITSNLANGGTLYYGPSPDKSGMKAWGEAETAGGFFLVKNAIPGMYYYISGNTDRFNVYYD